MKKFRIRYDSMFNYGLAYETIEAKGMIEASELASSHLNELRKNISPSVIIGQIREIKVKPD